jgi:hypothetical protein
MLLNIGVAEFSSLFYVGLADSVTLAIQVFCKA